MTTAQIIITVASGTAAVACVVSICLVLADRWRRRDTTPGGSFRRSSTWDRYDRDQVVEKSIWVFFAAIVGIAIVTLIAVMSGK